MIFKDEVDFLIMKSEWPWPTPKYIAIYLCGACVIVGALQLIFGTDVFVLDRSLMWSEPWRIVTSIFAHANAGHLLSNMFALGLFGLVLEGRIGPSRVLGLFILSGVLVNLATPYPVSLGASGAIYAIIGALAVLRPFMVVWIEYLPMPMVVAGLVYLVQDSIGAFVPDNVGHLAHIWGLVIGVAAGFYWRKEFGDDVHWPRSPKRSKQLEQEIDEWEQAYMGKE